MFKKGCPINQRTLLSGADRKKLKKGIEKEFGKYAASAAGEGGGVAGGTDASDASGAEGGAGGGAPSWLEAVLPRKAGDLELLKAPSPSRTVIYLHDGDPIIVDTAGGKGDLFPTVFGLWRAPCMLPCVFVKHPYVTQYLINGADLMLPGVTTAEGLFPSVPFEKGDLLAVGVPGNPCPLAVGTATMSRSDALARAGQNLKGKLVAILHVYRDCLWSELGGRRVPNAGFLAGAVVPLGAGTEALEGDDVDDDDDDDEEGVGGEGEGDQGGKGGDAGKGGRASAAAASASAVAAALSAASISGGAEGRDEEAAAEVVDMDALLEQTLLQALTRSVKDAEHLPLAGSALWAQHMTGCRPAGSVVDVKKTKHKKMSKFLQAYGGKGGMLTLKEDKHSGDVIITAIDRKHPLLADFHPLALRLTAAGAGGEASSSLPATQGSVGGAGSGPSAATSNAGGGPGGGGPGGGGGELVIEELWKPGKELRLVLEALHIRSDVLLTEKEAGEVAFKYMRHAGLDAASPDPTSLVLDATLCDALFKGLVKKGEPYPTHLPKADLRACFLKRCQAQYRITRGGGGGGGGGGGREEMTIVKKGTIPVLCISAKKKKQGHKITRVVGMEPFLISPEQMAADCQKRFASATTTNELPGRNQGSEVVIQGHVEGAGVSLADFLSKTYGIPRKFIDVKK